ncbi:hypothetical protein ACQY0O_008180 [Thecaphora frezii]
MSAGTSILTASDSRGPAAAQHARAPQSGATGQPGPTDARDLGISRSESLSRLEADLGPSLSSVLKTFDFSSPHTSLHSSSGVDSVRSDEDEGADSSDSTNLTTNPSTPAFSRDKGASSAAHLVGRFEGLASPPPVPPTTTTTAAATASPDLASIATLGSQFGPDRVGGPSDQIPNPGYWGTRRLLYPFHLAGDPYAIPAATPPAAAATAATPPADGLAAVASPTASAVTAPRAVGLFSRLQAGDEIHASPSPPLVTARPLAAEPEPASGSRSGRKHSASGSSAGGSNHTRARSGTLRKAAGSIRHLFSSGSAAEPEALPAKPRGASASNLTPVELPPAPVAHRGPAAAEEEPELLLDADSDRGASSAWLSPPPSASSDTAGMLASGADRRLQTSDPFDQHAPQLARRASGEATRHEPSRSDTLESSEFGSSSGPSTGLHTPAVSISTARLVSRAARDMERANSLASNGTTSNAHAGILAKATITTASSAVIRKIGKADMTARPIRFTKGGYKSNNGATSSQADSASIRSGNVSILSEGDAEEAAGDTDSAYPTLSALNTSRSLPTAQDSSFQAGHLSDSLRGTPPPSAHLAAAGLVRSGDGDGDGSGPLPSHTRSLTGLGLGAMGNVANAAASTSPRNPPRVLDPRPRGDPREPAHSVPTAAGSGLDGLAVDVDAGSGAASRRSRGPTSLVGAPSPSKTSAGLVLDVVPELTTAAFSPAPLSSASSWVGSSLLSAHEHSYDGGSTSDSSRGRGTSISTNTSLTEEPVWGQNRSVTVAAATAADPTLDSLANFAFPSPVMSGSNLPTPTPGSAQLRGLALHAMTHSMHSTASTSNGWIPESVSQDSFMRVGGHSRGLTSTTQVSTSSRSHVPASSMGGSSFSMLGGGLNQLGLSQLVPMSREAMLNRLVLDQARVDCQGYGMMSLEDVANAKRELKALESKISSMKVKLKVEMRIRDAAVALRRAHRKAPSTSLKSAPGSPARQNGLVSPLNEARARRNSISASEAKAEDEAKAALAKVDKVMRDLLKLTDRAQLLRRTVLEHQAAALVERVDALEADRAMIEEQLPRLASSASSTSVAPLKGSRSASADIGSASQTTVPESRALSGGDEVQVRNEPDEPYQPKGPSYPFSHKRLVSDTSSIGSGFSFLDASLPEQVRRLTRELAQTRSSLDQAKRQLASTRQEIAESQSQSDAFKQELEQSRRSAQAALDELSRAKEELRTLEEQTEQDRQATQAAVMELAEAKRQLQTLEQRTEQDQEMVQATAAELAQTKEQLRTLEQQTDQDRRAAQDAIAELSTAREQLQSLMREPPRAQDQNEIERLRHQLSLQQRDLAESQDVLQQTLQRRLEVERQEHAAKLTQELEVARREVEERLRGQIEEHESNARAAQEALQARQDLLDRLQRELQEATEARNRQSSNATDELKAQVAAASAELVAVKEARRQAEELAAHRASELERVQAAHVAALKLASEQGTELQRLAAAYAAPEKRAEERGEELAHAESGQAVASHLASEYAAAKRLAEERAAELERVQAAHAAAQKLAIDQATELQRLSAAHAAAERLAEERTSELARIEATAIDLSSQYASVKKLTEDQALELERAQTALAAAEEAGRDRAMRAEDAESAASDTSARYASIKKLAEDQALELERAQTALAAAEKLAHASARERTRADGAQTAAPEDLSVQYASIKKLAEDQAAELVRARAALGAAQKLAQDRARGMENVQATAPDLSARYASVQKLAQEQALEPERAQAALASVDELAQASSPERRRPGSVQAAAELSAQYAHLKKLAEDQALELERARADLEAAEKVVRAGAASRARTENMQPPADLSAQYAAAKQLADDRAAELERAYAALAAAEKLAQGTTPELERARSAQPAVDLSEDYAAAKRLADDRALELERCQEALAAAEKLAEDRALELERLAVAHAATEKLAEDRAAKLARMEGAEAATADVSAQHAAAQKLAEDRALELERAQAALGAARRLAEDSASELRRAEAALAAAEKLAAERASELEQLRSLHAAAKEQVAQQSVDLEQARNAQATAEKLAAERSAELQTMAAAHASAEKLAEVRAEELRKLRAAHAAAEQLATQRSLELEQAKQVESSAEDAEARMKELGERHAEELERLATVHAAELQKLAAAHATLEKLANDRAAELQEVKAAHTAAEAKAAQRTAEVALVKEAYAAAERSAEDRAAELDQANAAHAAAVKLAAERAAELERVRQAYTAAENLASERVSELELIRSAMATTEEARKAAERRAAQHAAELQTLEHNHASVEKLASHRAQEVDALSAARSEAEQRLAELDDQLASMERALELLRAQLDEEQRARTAAEGQISAAQQLMREAQQRAEASDAGLRELELAVGAERRLMAEREELFHAFERRLESGEKRLQELDKRCARMLGKLEGREEMDDLLERIKAGTGGVSKKKKTAGQDIADLLTSMEIHVEDMANELARAGVAGALHAGAYASPALRQMENELDEAEKEALRWRKEADEAKRQLEELRALEKERSAKASAEAATLPPPSPKPDPLAASPMLSPLPSPATPTSPSTARLRELERQVERLTRQNGELERQLRSSSLSPSTASAPAPGKGVGSLINKFGGGNVPARGLGVGASPLLGGPAKRSISQSSVASVGAAGEDLEIQWQLEALRKVALNMAAMLPDFDAEPSTSIDLIALQEAFDALPLNPSVTSTPTAGDTLGATSAIELQHEFEVLSRKLRRALAASRLAVSRALRAEGDAETLAAQIRDAESKQHEYSRAASELEAKLSRSTSDVEALRERERKLEQALAEVREQASESSRSRSSPTSSSSLGLIFSADSLPTLSPRKGAKALPAVATSASPPARRPPPLKPLVGGSNIPYGSWGSAKRVPDSLAPPSPGVADDVTSPGHLSPIHPLFSSSSPVRSPIRSFAPPFASTLETRTGGKTPDTAIQPHNSSPARSSASLPAVWQGASSSSPSSSHSGGKNGPRTITLGMDTAALISKIRGLERELAIAQTYQKQSEKIREQEEALRAKERRIEEERLRDIEVNSRLLEELNESNRMLQAAQDRAAGRAA